MVIPIITMSSTYKMRIVVLRLQCMTHIVWSPLLSLYPNLPNALLNLPNHVQKYNLRPCSIWMHFCYRIKCLLIVYSILLSKILRNHSCFEPFNAKNPFTPLSTSLSSTEWWVDAAYSEEKTRVIRAYDYRTDYREILWKFFDIFINFE